MIKLNQELNIDMLNKFKLESILDDNLKNEIFDTLEDSLDFQDYCQQDGKTIELQGEIEIDIYKEPYICVYSRWSDIAFIYFNHRNEIRFYATKDVLIVDDYKSSRRIPKFVKNLIDEMIKFGLLINEED